MLALDIATNERGCRRSRRQRKSRREERVQGWGGASTDDNQSRTKKPRPRGFGDRRKSGASYTPQRPQRSKVGVLIARDVR